MTQHPAARFQQFAGYGVLLLAVLFAFGVGAYVLLRGNEDTPARSSALPGPTARAGTGVLEPNRPKEGEPAPNFALVDARDPSKIRKLSDYRGKAVILNWYASWCDPCKNEIPDFQAAQAAYPNDLTVIGVNYAEEPAKAVAILDKLGATYPALLDSLADIAAHYRVGQGLPVTFFIDKDGILRAQKTGEVKRDELPGYLARIGLSPAP